MHDGVVRRPAAYLMGLIRKAIEGDFRLWAARDIATKVPAPKAVRVQQAVPEPKSAERSGAPRSASPWHGPAWINCANNVG